MPPTTVKEILTCLLVGLLGYGAQISLTYGLRSAKAAPAIATSYLSVVWGVLAGYFVFKEVRPSSFCIPSISNLTALCSSSLIHRVRSCMSCACYAYLQLLAHAMAASLAGSQAAPHPSRGTSETVIFWLRENTGHVSLTTHA